MNLTRPPRIRSSASTHTTPPATKIQYGGIISTADIKANLRAHCLPDSLLNGAIPDYDSFLEERRRLMALKIQRWFELL